MAGRIDAFQGKLPKVDLKDRKILTLLTEDSRLTLNQMASRVMLSRDAVRYRIQRLQNLGVIQRFVPVLDFGQFGYSRFHLFLQLREMSEEQHQRIFKEFTAYPEVVSVIEYSDNYDVELVVLAKGAVDFDSFFSRVMNAHHSVIDDYVILERVREYCNRFLPQEFQALKRPKTIPRRREQQRKVDETDVRILEMLGEDARRSYFDIAEKVGLSSDAVSYRVKRLRNGVAPQLTAMTNLSALGYNWYTLLVLLRFWDAKHESKFRQIVEQHPNVMMAMKSIGEWNLLLYIAAKSQSDFHQIVKGIRAELQDVIRTYETLLGYREHVYKAMPPGLSHD